MAMKPSVPYPASGPAGIGVVEEIVPRYTIPVAPLPTNTSSPTWLFSSWGLRDGTSESPRTPDRCPLESLATRTASSVPGRVVDGTEFAAKEPCAHTLHR